MRRRFIEFYANLPQTLYGLYLIHSDEALVHNWIIDACRAIFQRQNQIIHRIDVAKDEDWQAAISLLKNLSLFGDNSAVIVSNKNNANISDKIQKQLIDFAKQCQNGQNQNVLIYETPKQDRRAQSKKSFVLFDECGTVIDGNLYDATMQQQALQQQAQRFLLSLSTDAWRFLLEHTENNLLAGYQALWRASTGAYRTLDVDDLLPYVVDDYDYSVFSLSDYLLEGNIYKAMHVLNFLKKSKGPNAVFFALNKLITTLLGLQAGQSAQSLGIWKNKEALYYNALSHTHISFNMINMLYDIEQIIKGLKTGDVWQKLTNLCISLCAHRPPIICAAT